MDKRRCAACRRVFEPRAQAPEQRYCSARACQRKRRRRWQRHKRRTDPDYRGNQAQAQRRWLQHQPEYWRRYRAEHPAYTAGNRAKQHARDRRRRQQREASGGAALAKMDVSTPISPPLSGTYHLIPVTAGLAKMDAWTVEIRALSIS